jgi:hypothetical protein
MKCKKWYNGGMCEKKFNFILRLPFNAIDRVPIAEKLATVILCSSCPHRRYILPKYALDPKLVWKYRSIWQNHSILQIIYGTWEIGTDIEVRAQYLMVALRSYRNKRLYCSKLLTVSEQMNMERAVLPVLTDLRNPAGNASPLRILEVRK